MKTLVRILSHWGLCLTVLVLCTERGHAEEFAWEPIGKINLTIAKNWTVAEKELRPEGLYIRLAAPPPRKGTMQLTFMALPMPVKGPEAKLEMLKLSFAPVLPQSMETKADVKSLEGPYVAHYAQFTDKELAGKKPKDTQYLLLRVAQVWFDHQLLGQMTLLFDDEEQEEVNEMMEMLKSLKVEQHL